MQTSETTSKIFQAIINFQHEIGKVEKSATNPFFKSKYAPLTEILSAIKEPMYNNELGFVQFPTDTGGLTTRLFHSSGEWLESTYFMQPTKNTPQDLGSVITYQRRYALGSILGLNIDEDDDGNKASKKTSDPFEIEVLLDECKDLQSLKSLFTNNQKVIESMPELKKLFTAKKESFK